VDVTNFASISQDSFSNSFLKLLELRSSNVCLERDFYLCIVLSDSVVLTALLTHSVALLSGSERTRNIRTSQVHCKGKSEI
jgi:hypothetical protein